MTRKETYKLYVYVEDMAIFHCPLSKTSYEQVVAELDDAYHLARVYEDYEGDLYYEEKIIDGLDKCTNRKEFQFQRTSFVLVHEIKIKI